MTLRSDRAERPERALFRHHRSLTRRFAARLGATEAEDLASEAVARGLARPAPDGRLAPWIETIFRNLLVDRRRQQGRRGEELPLADGLADGAVTPEEAVLEAERVRAVAAAMPAIPGELRDAVVARFLDDEDYETFAARQGISEGTARTRVYRGLVRLREALGGVRALLPVWPRWALAGGAQMVTALVSASAVAIFAIAPLASSRDAADGSVVTATQSHHGRRANAKVAGNDGNPAVGSRPPSAGTPDRHPARLRHPQPNARPPQSWPADDTVEPGDGKGADGAGAPVAVRHMTFDEDEIAGDLQQPGTLVVTGDPQRRKVDSLIEIPASFEPSMTKMIEDM